MMVGWKCVVCYGDGSSPGWGGQHLVRRGLLDTEDAVEVAVQKMETRGASQKAAVQRRKEASDAMTVPGTTMPGRHTGWMPHSCSSRRARPAGPLRWTKEGRTCSRLSERRSGVCVCVGHTPPLDLVRQQKPLQGSVTRRGHDPSSRCPSHPPVRDHSPTDLPTAMWRLQCGDCNATRVPKAGVRRCATGTCVQQARLVSKGKGPAARLPGAASQLRVPGPAFEACT